MGEGWGQFSQLGGTLEENIRKKERKCSRQAGKWVSKGAFETKSLQVRFLGFGKSKEKRLLWQNAFKAILSTIWLERNGRDFNGVASCRLPVMVYG